MIPKHCIDFVVQWRTVFLIIAAVRLGCFVDKRRCTLCLDMWLGSTATKIPEADESARAIRGTPVIPGPTPAQQLLPSRAVVPPLAPDVKEGRDDRAVPSSRSLDLASPAQRPAQRPANFTPFISTSLSAPPLVVHQDYSTVLEHTASHTRHTRQLRPLLPDTPHPTPCCHLIRSESNDKRCQYQPELRLSPTDARPRCSSP